MKTLYQIAIFLIMSFWALLLPAQTETSVKLDSPSILIGDQTSLEVGFTCPPAYRVIWPKISDTITSQIEIVRKSGLDSVMSNDQSSRYYFQRFVVTSFDSGFLVIPPLTIGYLMPGDTTIFYAETDAILLEVRTIHVNLEADFRDIKDPMAAPFTFREALPYMLAFLAALVIALAALYFWRKRKKAEPVFTIPLRPRIPAYQLALDALEVLRSKKLWQNGQIKEYHTELTDIVREYLMSRFNIHAHELTSEEILGAMNQTSINGQVREKLRLILILADMVKFAKLQPLPVENDRSLIDAMDFVRESHLMSDNAIDKHFKADSEPITAGSEIADELNPETNSQTQKMEGGKDVE